MINSDICFVGFDTSNYTTSVAVVDADGQVIANLKAPLPVADGACGLRQSDAVFSHVKNLPELCGYLRGATKGKTVRAVGVSAKPRDAEDSYMPCFLSGVAAAEAFSAAAECPLFRFSHQNGHIRAAAYSSGAQEILLLGKFAAFHVSGGTTEVLLVRPCEVGFDVTLVGGTEDMNAGQAIDRAGVMMGMKFPCGPAIEEFARGFSGKIPPVKVCVKDTFCNLSGLQNLSEKLWRETHDRGLVSAFVLEFISKTLKAMTDGVDKAYPDIPVLYAGGVMSNSIIKEKLSGRNNTYFAKPQFSADNAAGIALLCRDRFMANDD